MARLRKHYKDEEHEKDKKREKIRRIICNLLAVFWIIVIFVCGAFQHNDSIVGIGVIAIGVANAAYSVFAFTIRGRGWKVMTVYDSDELYRDKHRFSQRLVEQKEKDTQIGRWFIDIIIAISAIVFLIVGTIKLVS